MFECFFIAKIRPNNSIDTKTKASTIAKIPNAFTNTANGYKKIVSQNSVKLETKLPKKRNNCVCLK